MRKALQKFNRVFHSISCMFLVALMAITVIDIVGRALFEFRFRGIYELTGIFLVILVYFAFGNAERNKENVEIDFFYSYYSRYLKSTAVRVIVYYLKQVIFVAIAAIIAWRVFAHGIYMMDTGARTASLQIPSWPVILLAFLGLLGLLLVVLSDLIFSQPVGGKNDGAS
ncbi:MAG: hypothetical protein AVO34_00240 [Firmicutes bacterium ML8_F2]|jgi:TRAP-type transport system small permease protein|nr:MAG: hypothetical protein AVO34_00240 [Firmicutes bacterium ML8_F2]